MADPPPIKQKVSTEADTSGIEQVQAELAKLQELTNSNSAVWKQAGDLERQRVRDMKQTADRLGDLIAAERRHAQAVQDGIDVSEKDKRLSVERKKVIDDYSRSLAKLEDEQEEVNRELRASVGAHRASKDGADDNAKSIDSLGGILGGAAGAVKGMALGILGSAGAVAAFQAWREEIELTNERMVENERLTRQAAESRLDLAALKGYEDPAELKELDRLAIFSGRSVGEAARLATVTQSILPADSYTDEQREAFLAEVASQAQTSSATLPEIAGAIYPLIVEGLTARQAGNLFQAGVKQAGEPDPSQFAQSAARFVSLGKEVGGLDVGESVGFAAAATGLGLDKSTAETGLKNLVLGIRTPSNADSQALLERLEINDDVDLRDALKRIADANAKGEISRTELVNLAGREGLEVALKLGRQETLDAFLKRVDIVDAAEDTPNRIAAEQSAEISKPGTIQGFNLLGKQARAGEETIRSSDLEAARRSAAKDILAELVAEKQKSGELSEADAAVILKEFAYQLAQGQTIERAIDIAERQQSGASVDVPVPNPTADEFFNIELIRTNTNPIKFAVGNDRAQDDFLQEELLKRLSAPPETDPETLTLPDAPPPAPAPAPALPELPDDLKPQIPDATSGSAGGPGGRTFINYGNIYQGSGDPMWDDLDGRMRV